MSCTELEDVLRVGHDGTFFASKTELQDLVPTLDHSQSLLRVPTLRTFHTRTRLEMTTTIELLSLGIASLALCVSAGALCVSGWNAFRQAKIDERQLKEFVPKPFIESEFTSGKVKLIPGA